MEAEEIKQNKKKFLSLCRKDIQREGIEDLLKYLDGTDFFTAPSSAKFHLNEAGGLCKHSLNVYDVLTTLYERVAHPLIKANLSPFTNEITEESLTIAALFHDVCKIGIYHEAERWRKDSAGRWESYKGYEVRENFPFGHGEKSCIMLSKYIQLNRNELLAIRWHMGMYDIGENGSAQRRAFYEACDQSLLTTLLQCADSLASKVAEKTTVL